MKNFKQIGSSINAAVNMVKRSDNNEKNINYLYSFRPIYYFSRFFGLMPFSIIYDSSGEVQRPIITIFDGLWFVISMCSYSFAVFLSIRLKIMKQPSPTFVTILGNTFIMMTILYGVLAVAIDMCNRYKFIEIVKKFTGFDKEVGFLFKKNSYVLNK